MFSRFVHVKHVSVLHSFLLHPLHAYTPFYLFIHKLLNIWILSTWGLLRIMFLWTFACKFLGGCMFSVLLCTHLGVELLGHLLTLCLTLRGTAKLCSKAAVLFHVPISRGRGLQFLHIPANTSDRLSLHCSRPRVHAVPSRRGFGLHLQGGYWCWASPHVRISYPCIFFGKMSIQTFCPFNRIICLSVTDPKSYRE